MRAAIAVLLGSIGFCTNALAAEPDCRTVPVVSTRTLPPYPKASVQAQEEGVVLAEVDIGASGIPSEVRIVTSSGYPNLDAATLGHVKTVWRWTAVPQECSARSTKVQVTMDLRDAGIPAKPRVTTISMAKDDFPLRSWERNQHGTTSLAVELAAPNNFKRVFLLKSSGHPELDQQAQQIARRYKFVIGQMDEKPVTTLFYLDIVWPKNRQ